MRLMIKKGRRYALKVAALVLLHIASSCGDGGDLAASILERDAIIDTDDEYVVVLGDVQEYTNSRSSAAPLQASLEWVAAQNLYANNISCVLQVGDVTNSNSPSQWAVFEEIARKAVGNGVPVFSCTGNHDYDWGEWSKINDRNSSLFSQVLGFCFPDSVIESRFEEGKYENLIVRLPLKSADLRLIILEFGPRKEAVQWAADWVKDHPEQRFLLLTHEMLSAKGDFLMNGNYAENQFHGTQSTYSTPKQIAERLILPNPNIYGVFCGHNGFAAIDETLENTDGRAVPIILFNLQYQANGGDSMILLMRFPHGRPGEAELCVYKTMTKEVIDTPLNGRTIKF